MGERPQDDSESPAKRARLEPSTSSSTLASPSTERSNERSTRGRGAPRGRGKGKRGRGGGKGNERQGRNVGWDNETIAEKKAHGEDGEKAERRPKRKVVLYVGYAGSEYSGLQINKNVKTVEGTLFESLCKAGCISEDNADDPLKVGLHRAARTDAGVHAAINMLSLKLILEPASKDAATSIEDHLNAYLPGDIRVWRVIRVQNSFNPRTLCDARTYSYTFPSFLLLPPKPGTFMTQKLADLAAPQAIESYDPFWTGVDAERIAADELGAKKGWRVTAPILARCRELLACLLGSHNFHNFTIGANFADRSSTRVMRELTLKDPEVAEDGVEWLTVELHGQSFMLHQIRKMISMLILVCRSPAPATLVPELFGPVKVSIPKAPAIGLRLERPHFDRYNRRVAETPQSRDANEHRDELDFPSELLGRVAEWTGVNIAPRMRDERAFADWLGSIDENTALDLDYLNPHGTVPVKAKAAGGEAGGAADAEDEDAGLRGADQELEG